MSIRVILADDYPITREGIKAILDKKAGDIEVIGIVSNGRELLDIAKENPADVYIVDISMPVLNGIEAAEKLIKRKPDSKVIILSMYSNRMFVERALKVGVKGYIPKESATEEIIKAIYEVYCGKFFISQSVLDFVVNGFLTGGQQKHLKGEEPTRLTTREKEILQLAGEGLNDKQIARKVKVSVHTAHCHRKNIMRKLGFHKQTELIHYALKEGFSKL